ncbi:MAG: arginase [Acidipila sp.]|nr:arginase [Acidipila sp.]
MPQKVRIIGVPMDLGASRRGVDMGPSALRVGGLATHIKQMGLHLEDIGNIPVKQPEEQHYGEKKAKYLNEIAETCQGLADIVEKSLEEGMIPIVMGGDHSIAVGTMGGVSRYFQKKEKRIGLVWLDAHADMNTPDTSPSGNIHGMPLASIVGFGAPELTDLVGPKPMVNPRNVCLVGARDIDSKEKRIIKESGVHVFTMRDLDERGMREVMAEALRFANDDTDGVAVSLDLDFVDPSDAPGVGTPVRGGVTYREAHLAMEMLADSKGVVSLEVVEVNPVIDHHNQTAVLGVELLLSGLGKKIL